MKYPLVLILWQSDIIVWISVISAQNQVKAESSLGILEETNCGFVIIYLLVGVTPIYYRNN